MHHNNHSMLSAWLLLIGRVFLASIFIVSGVGKILGFSGTVEFMQSADVPFASLSLVIAIILELGGALLLVSGWKARLGAKMLIFFTTLATVFFHLDLADQANQIAFFKNLGIIGGLLYVIVIGPGRLCFGYKKYHAEVPPHSDNSPAV